MSMTHFAGIPLQVLTDQGRMPDWHRALITHEGHVPGSDITIIQYDGYGPWRLTCRMLFPSVRDFQRFAAMQGRRASMRHPENMTATAPPDATRVLNDGLYVEWPDVVCEGIDDGSVRRLRDGRVIATATFRRPHIGAVPA